MKRVTIFGTPTATDAEVIKEFQELEAEERKIAKIEAEVKQEEKERRKRVRGGIPLNLIQ